MFSNTCDNMKEIHIQGMNRQDTLEVIKSLPKMERSCMKYYEGALRYYKGIPEMIWRYTGGMIWHVKLLLNSIGDRLRKESREVVYPSDVIEGLNLLLKDPDIFQHQELACTDEERTVLKVLADCQKIAEMPVSFRRIRDALPRYLSRPDSRISKLSDDGLRKALDSLKKRTLIKLIEDDYSVFTDIFRLHKRGENIKKFVLKKAGI